MIGQASLSLDQAPPISVPFRFFLTAPLFLFCAGLLLLVYGSDALVSRWSPITLALTHLITLGFLTSVMCGAVMQILPVLAGSAVPASLWVSRIVHLLLTAGVISLVSAFLFSFSPWMGLAMFCLGGALFVFVVSVAIALWRVKIPNETVIGMSVAIASLAITAVLGLFLAASFIWPIGYGYIHTLTDSHMGWGIMGWVGLLVMGVAYQVVPMFQMTPEYPGWMVKYLTRTLFVACLLWGVLTIAHTLGLLSPLWAECWLLLMVLGYLSFAMMTLDVQKRRRRRLPDVTLKFWRIGMFSQMAAFLLWFWGPFWGEVIGEQARLLLLGGCLLAGFALSVINGMLYKILPFLSWFHLQHRSIALLGFGRVKIPNMKEFLPDRLAKQQYMLHLLALMLLVMAVLAPDIFSRPLGFAICASSLLLEFNLVQAVVRYRNINSEISKKSNANEEMTVAEMSRMRGMNGTSA
ncbi:MAG: hypothetical protein L3J28_13040 [Candidatus Polarisedimenticolaceae bacterium]|nr:hypothetical protein [Candidatus Polarisedimenticolaceae bacterium]